MNHLIYFFFLITIINSSCSTLFSSRKMCRESYFRLEKFTKNFSSKKANLHNAIYLCQDTLTKVDLKRAYLYNKDSTKLFIYIIILKLYEGHLQYCHQTYDLYYMYKKSKGVSKLLLKEIFTTPSIVESILVQKGDKLFTSYSFYKWLSLQENLIKNDRIRIQMVKVKEAEQNLKNFLNAK